MMRSLTAAWNTVSPEVIHTTLKSKVTAQMNRAGYKLTLVGSDLQRKMNCLNLILDGTNYI